MVKIKLLICLLAGFFVQDQWVDALHRDTAFYNSEFRKEAPVLASLTVKIICHPESFPEYEEASLEELSQVLLDRFGGLIELGKFVESNFRQDPQKKTQDCEGLSETRRLKLESLVKDKYGVDYFQEVSRNEEILENVFIRLLSREVLEAVKSYEIVTSESDITSARFNGFVVAFLLTAFVVFLGRLVVMFGFYLFTTKDQPKTLDELLCQIKIAWSKAVDSRVDLIDAVNKETEEK